MAANLPESITRTLPAFVPIKSVPKLVTEEMVIISLSMDDKSITVKWPATDSDGCARFIRGLVQ